MPRQNDAATFAGFEGISSNSRAGIVIPLQVVFRQNAPLRRVVD
jgi:hypothetical protein